MTLSTHLPAAAFAALLLAAGSVGAAPKLDLSLPQFTGAVAQAPVANAGVPAQAIPDLADPLDPQAPTKLQIQSVQSEVFAKTAVERRFSKREDLSASAGFLCGLQPGHGDSGGAAAYGVDPHGRFLGAKLSLAF